MQYEFAKIANICKVNQILFSDTYLIWQRPAYHHVDEVLEELFIIRNVRFLQGGYFWPGVLYY